MSTHFMNTSIFKAYDIRGIYPTDINTETVKIVAKALVKLFPDGELVVAYDTRHGSIELNKALEEAIAKESLAAGKKHSITNIGIATTPLFYFTVCDRKAVGGAMITASHNPKEYNGIKMVKANAETVSGTEVLQVINSL
jgi:phosphomannomutase